MQCSEKEFMGQVIELARICGWLVYHTNNSRRSAPGFPDLVFVKGSVMFMAELKVGNNRLSPAQRRWLDALIGADVQVYVWRPSDWSDIEKALHVGRDGET